MLGEPVKESLYVSPATEGRDVHRPGHKIREQLALLLEVGEAALEEFETSPQGVKLLKAKGKLDRLRRQRGMAERELDDMYYEADRLAQEEMDRMLALHGYRTIGSSLMLLIEMPPERRLEYIRPLEDYGVRTPEDRLEQIAQEVSDHGRQVKRERLRQPDVKEIKQRRDAIPVYEQALEVNRIAQQRVNEIVSRFRQVGTEQLPTPRDETIGGTPHAYKVLRQAAAILPADWAVSSRAFFSPGGGLVAAAGATRASYSHGKSRRYATVSYGRHDHGLPPAILTHELVHHFEEARPQLRVAEWAFWQKRVRGGDFDGPLAPLQTLYQDMDGGVHELCRRGGFDDDYASKSYGGDWESSYELLSHGLERLLWPATNVKSDMRRLPVTSDREYASFLLGALICL